MQVGQRVIKFFCREGSQTFLQSFGQFHVSLLDHFGKSSDWIKACLLHTLKV